MGFVTTIYLTALLKNISVRSKSKAATCH